MTPKAHLNEGCSNALYVVFMNVNCHVYDMMTERHWLLKLNIIFSVMYTVEYSRRLGDIMKNP